MATQFGIGSDNSLSLKVMTKGHSPAIGLTFILAKFFPTPLDNAADLLSLKGPARIRL